MVPATNLVISDRTFASIIFRRKVYGNWTLFWRADNSSVALQVAFLLVFVRDRDIVSYFCCHLWLVIQVKTDFVIVNRKSNKLYEYLRFFNSYVRVLEYFSRRHTYISLLLILIRFEDTKRTADESDFCVRCYF